MAVVSKWTYAGDSEMGDTDRIWMSGKKDELANLEVGQWSNGTIIVNSSNENIGSANNAKYISSNQVGFDEGVKFFGDLGINDCTFEISWEDQGVSTELNNCKFYAFDGINPDNPPESMTVVAYETSSSGGQSEGASGRSTWNDLYDGINTVSNALLLGRKSPSLQPHIFYIGFSVRVNEYGTHTNGELRLSFDVS